MWLFFYIYSSKTEVEKAERTTYRKLESWSRTIKVNHKLQKTSQSSYRLLSKFESSNCNVRHKYIRL